MTNKELYSKEYLELFMPDGVEFIYDILQNIGYNNRNFQSEKGRKKALSVIEKLLELRLIEIFSWGDYDRKLKDQVISNEKIMEHLNKVWFIGADFPDFHGMPMFKYKNWYLKALEREGLTSTSDWKTFVSEKIGNLEKWIEDKRPR